MKILLGVTLTSTICISGLVYAFQQANETVNSTVNEVLAIREKDSRHLREMIVFLQDKMLSFNRYLKVNPENQIKDWLNENFTQVQTVKLKGRNSWQRVFDRHGRRDLANNKAVIMGEENVFAVSFGLRQDNGAFSEVIEKHIYDLPEGVKFANVQQQLEKIINQAENAGVQQANLDQLAAVIADEALLAEQARTEILRFAEIIDIKEKDLLATKQHNRRFILGLSTIVCAINLLVIFLLTKTIVERPLRTLIIAIDELRAGKLPENSWHNRNDQIGVLAGAVNNFRDALIEIKHESQRKQKEQSAIDEALELMSSTIN